MHDMLARLPFFSCIFNPNMAQQDMYEHYRKWMTAFGKELIDRSASGFFHMQCLWHKKSVKLYSLPAYVPQLGSGHDQRGGTATNRERNINAILQI